MESAAGASVSEERRVTTTIFLKPPDGLNPVGGYDFDTFALEFDQHGDLLDLRFELGALSDFYWALPVAPNGPLRLIHVNSAVVHVDEPSVIDDPCALELAPLEWHGELGTVAATDGARVVVSVFVRASTAPALYRCVVELRCPDGALRTFTLQNDVE